MIILFFLLLCFPSTRPVDVGQLMLRLFSVESRNHLTLWVKECAEPPASGSPGCVSAASVNVQIYLQSFVSAAAKSLKPIKMINLRLKEAETNTLSRCLGFLRYIKAKRLQSERCDFIMLHLLICKLRHWGWNMSEPEPHLISFCCHAVLRLSPDLFLIIKFKHVLHFLSPVFMLAQIFFGFLLFSIICPFIIIIIIIVIVIMSCCCFSIPFYFILHNLLLLKAFCVHF